MSNFTSIESNISDKALIPKIETNTFTSKDGYTASEIPTSSTHACDIWYMGSRLALQVVLLIMILLNIAAAIVVFSVPINIRGRHVAFLFICVRVLNVLDLYQCSVIFFFPLGMPPDCQNPNPFYCNLSGFCFATGTILSPLIAVVMALDRLYAVFFHLRYKAKPQTTRKCLMLGGVMGVYIFYFTLPFYTNFGKYVAVSWLSLCSFEWGVEYREFNLVLFSTTAVLTTILIAANIAILIKVQKRKKEFKRFNESARKVGIQKNKANDGRNKPRSNGTKLRKCKSVGDLSLLSFGKNSPPRTPSSLQERRRRNVQPLRISLSLVPNDEHHLEVKMNTFGYTSPVCDTAMLFPPSSHKSPSTYSGSLPPSPLVLSENELSSAPRTPTSLNQSTSWNATCEGARHRTNTTRTPDCDRIQLSPLSHRTMGSYDLRKKAFENTSRGKLDDSCDSFLSRSINSRTDDKDSSGKGSTNSLFSNVLDRSLRFLRIQRTDVPKRKQMRRNVSRITKMTAAISTLFCVLYVPFLIRKLVQVIPEDYYAVYVPPAVDIITLFLPLLSSLCNPILYVFYNPHYREKCESLYRTLLCARKPLTEANHIVNVSTTHAGLNPIQKKRQSKRIKIFSRKKTKTEAGFKNGMDDVFVSTGRMNEDHAYESYVSDSSSICSTRRDVAKQRSLRQTHLNKVQRLHYRRTKSADYLN